MSESIDEAILFQEMKEAAKAPAFYINRFIVTTAGTGLRVGFLEKGHQNSDPIVRTSVFMTREDAKELSDVLTKVLNPPRKEDA